VQREITDDLEALLEILPPDTNRKLAGQEDVRDLIEVVLDLGRLPEARFPKREMELAAREIQEGDIDYVVARVGEFGEDNRAGIERTLHRISAIRNRRGRIVGLTCRVGRAVFGTIKIIEDLVLSGKSILLLGRPGVGKTTMLREMARVLADDAKKRVVIVDTSNEIAGDGDIPHPAIGHARRMQVASPALQHNVMIEAVENHMPEVIVIDEIGTELEALAARTIAERGVQLVGTAHGNTLDNLMMNPTLADLIGGIQSVTLGDEEAKRRGTQKSILERKSPPTFDIIVEIQERDRVAIHEDVAEAVDGLLRGQPPASNVRWVSEDGEINIAKDEPEPSGKPAARRIGREKENGGLKVYLFGVNRSRIVQMAREMSVDLDVADRPGEAAVFITSKNYFRRRPQQVRDAEAARVPIYVLRSNTPPQIRQLLGSLTSPGQRERAPRFQDAVAEAEAAVEQVTEGEETVELSPQSSYIRRLQHLIAQQHDLNSQSQGRDPNRRVKIYKEKAR
jgi:stage III sporulation protein SpoIIIAA